MEKSLESSKAKCKECKRKRELTIHGTCWPCHLKGVNINAQIEARRKD